MRDTRSMMEDTLSEDMVMDCRGGGGGLGDLVDLATDLTDSSATTQDAAERLITLLGVDQENDDLLCSSEDEGVELDELDDDEDDQQNSKLLHQLAASLAKELQSHQKQNGTWLLARNPFDRDRTDVVEASYLAHSCLEDQDVKGTTSRYHNNVLENRQRQETPCSFDKRALSKSYQYLDYCFRIHKKSEKARSRRRNISASWSAGWDACATEALRYLVEDEGLPPDHPTVLAMKDHLELQRERTFVQYTT